VQSDISPGQIDLAAKEQQAVLSFYQTHEEHEESATVARGCPKMNWVSYAVAVSRAFVSWKVAAIEKSL